MNLIILVIPTFGICPSYTRLRPFKPASSQNF
jgi:hypothetical protein